MRSSDVSAIVSRGPLSDNGWNIEKVNVRKPGPGELLVEMVASGVCHTDVMIGNLPADVSPVAFYPRVLGHEGSAYVREIGPGVTVARPGDAVLLSFSFCNDCQLCAAGHRTHCLNFNKINFESVNDIFRTVGRDTGSVSGGFFGQSSFASVSVVYHFSVVNVQQLVNDTHELAIFSLLGCGVQTGSGSVSEVAKAGPDDVLCVVGLGGVGMGAVMTAKIRGCRTIIGIDRVENRLSLAKELGATAVVNSNNLGDKTLLEVVQALADGLGPTITIETTGVPALIKESLSFTRPVGKIIQVGAAPLDFKLGIDVFDWMVQGKQYVGAIEGHVVPSEYIPCMIQWYREGRFPINKLVKLFPVQEYKKALEEMHNGTTIKPVLRWT